MIRRHLTPALLCFCALLACCLLAPVARHSWRTTVSLAVAGAGTAIALLEGPGAAGRRRRAGVLAMSVSLGLMLGTVSILRMDAARESAFLPVPAEAVTDFVGTASQDSTLDRRGDAVVRVRVESVGSQSRGTVGRSRGNVLLFVGGDTRFSLGQRIRVHAPLSPEPRFGPDPWTAHARRADITALGYAGPAWAFRAEARSALHRAVTRIGYPACTLLEALLIGVREDVPPDLYDRFLRTGSLHILALSGLHVTVLYGAAGLLLWFLGRRWQRFAAATAVILFFQFLAGFMPSLLRATVMIVVGGVAVLLDRDREPINVLALSGIVLLAIDPFQCFTLSFQLSFLALAGILVLGALVQRPLSGILPRFALLAVAMSAGAQAATLPLVIAAFGSWYPSGLLASLVLVPLTTAYLWAGLAWLPLSLVPWTALQDFASAAFAVFYRVISASADVFARIPGIVVPPPAVPWLAAGAGLAVAAAATVLPLKARAAR